MPYTETTTFSRLELYEMAWTRPMTALGRELSLPPLTLSGIMKKMDIPLPPSGHWQKVGAGKPYERPPLPDPERDASQEFEVVRLKDGETWAELPNPTSRGYRDYEIYEQQPENAIVVAEQLADPHKLVREAQQLLSKGEVDEEYGWIRPRRNNSRTCLDICVSPGKLEIALRIFDALIRALEQRGLKVQLSGEKSVRESTYVTVDGEQITFGIYERLDREEVLKIKSWDRDTRWTPNGKLAMRIYGRYSGAQKALEGTMKKPLDQRLNDFIVKLYREAEDRESVRAEKARRQQEWEAECLIREERERLRQQERRRQEQEAAKVSELEETVRFWLRAKNIREFVAAVNLAHAPYGGVPKDSEHSQYLAWALSVADQLDPLTSAEVNHDVNSADNAAKQ